MGLWLAFIGVCVVAAAFHWLSLNPSSAHARAVRPYYWGDPLFQALSLDFFALFLLTLIILRASGNDVLAAWN